MVWCLLSVPISSSGRGCVLIVLSLFGFWFRFRAWAFVSCRFVFFLWGRVCVPPGARSCFWLGLWLSSVSGFFWGVGLFCWAGRYVVASGFFWGAFVFGVYVRPGFGFVSLVGLCSYVLACLVRGLCFWFFPSPAGVSSCWFLPLVVCSLSASLPGTVGLWERVICRWGIGWG